MDRNIEEAVGTSPDLAVSSTGYADVVYRVVHSTSVGVSELRPGDVNESVRVARFNGLRWSNLGAINRDSAVGMRPATQENAPQIAIGPTGNGVVVWQEPDIEGVARIWARRIFGSTLDYVMPVSASSFAARSHLSDQPPRTRRWETPSWLLRQRGGWVDRDPPRAVSRYTIVIVTHNMQQAKQRAYLSRRIGPASGHSAGLWAYRRCERLVTARRCPVTVRKTRPTIMSAPDKYPLSCSSNEQVGAK